MGIPTLYDLLASAEEKGVKISRLQGKTLAVDLSTWIAELKTAPNVQQFPNLYIKNLYYRLLEFLREGVQLVIVIDGKAPALKHEALQSRQQAQYGSSSGSFSPERRMLAKSVQKCVEMFESLGLPCIDAEGEGEATCAHLEATKLVDGCITEDSDYFCYGGQTLYRNLRKENRVYVVDKVSDVAVKAGLGRRDLVALALLMGCDYCKGVESVGRERARELIKYLKARDLDILDRLVGWRSNEELSRMASQISEKHEHLSHCRKCDHLGRVSAHRKVGCGLCRTETDCVESCERVCPCDWHVQKRLHEDNKQELNIRSKALTDPGFPDQKVINEFLQPRRDHPVEFAQIDVPRLVKYLAGVFSFGTSEILDRLVPCIILQQMMEPQLYGTKLFTPIRVNKQCKDKFVECYVVSWDKSESNSWADDQHSTSVEVKVEKGLLESCYPELVKRYQEEQSAARAAKKPGKKRKNAPGSDSTQRTLTQFTKVKKKLMYPAEPEPVLPETEPSSSATDNVLIDKHSRLSQPKSVDSCEQMTKISETLCATSSSSDTKPCSSKTSGPTSSYSSKSCHSFKQTEDFTVIETDEDTDEETDTKTPGNQLDTRQTKQVVTSKSTTRVFTDVDRNEPRGARTISKGSKNLDLCNQKSIKHFFKTLKPSKPLDSSEKRENHR